MPTIQWFKEDGTEISDKNDRYEISYSTETGIAQLVIKNTMTFDEMSYKCTATNQYGSAKTIGVLVVKGRVNYSIKYNPFLVLIFHMFEASKKRSSSRSPARSLTPPSPSISGPGVPSKSRSISPLRNIDVPPSNLQPVKEESEVSSSEHEHETSKAAAKPAATPTVTPTTTPTATPVSTLTPQDSVDILVPPNPVTITVSRDQLTPTREEEPELVKHF